MPKPSGHSARALLENRRWCYFIPLTAFEPNKGFRVAVVIEGERGFFPTGTASEAPWYWGMTYAEAEERAARVNHDELNLSTREVVDIHKAAGLL